MEYYKHNWVSISGFTLSITLIWLCSLKEPKHRIVTWIEVLSEFNFEVEYQPGMKPGNADAISRCPNPRDCSCPLLRRMNCLVSYVRNV